MGMQRVLKRHSGRVRMQNPLGSCSEIDVFIIITNCNFNDIIKIKQIEPKQSNWSLLKLHKYVSVNSSQMNFKDFASELCIFTCKQIIAF